MRLGTQVGERSGRIIHRFVTDSVSYKCDQSTVVNGEAGRPSLLYRFTRGFES